MFISWFGVFDFITALEGSVKQYAKYGQRLVGPTAFDWCEGWLHGPSCTVPSKPAAAAVLPDVSSQQVNPLRHSGVGGEARGNRCNDIVSRDR